MATTKRTKAAPAHTATAKETATTTRDRTAAAAKKATVPASASKAVGKKAAAPATGRTSAPEKKPRPRQVASSSQAKATATKGELKTVKKAAKADVPGAVKAGGSSKAGKPAEKMAAATVKKAAKQVAAKPAPQTTPSPAKATKAAKAEKAVKAVQAEKADTTPTKHAGAAGANAENATARSAPSVAPLRPREGFLSQRSKPAERRTTGYTDERWLNHQRKALETERTTYLEQAASLRAEAEYLVEEMEPGDVQFDDESGEGGTVTVDRERDLALSAQALQTVEEIDHAARKVEAGTYGICENCGRLIPKPRLEALPFARLCIDCKSGGLSRR